MEEKRCSKCKTSKLTSEFYPKRSADGTSKPDSWCKSCKKIQNDLSVQRNIAVVRERLRIYHIKNREKHLAACKRNAIRRKYGISFGEYDALIKSQQGLCKICNEPLTSRWLTHIDHCHDTQSVRGILCKNCNNGLGMFRENTAALRRAAEYLEDHKKRTEVRRQLG